MYLTDYTYLFLFFFFLWGRMIYKEVNALQLTQHKGLASLAHACTGLGSSASRKLTSDFARTSLSDLELP